MLFAIDPSIRKCGLAVFAATACSKLLDARTLRSTESKLWLRRSDEMVRLVANAIETYRKTQRLHAHTCRVLIEMPSHYSSAVGNAAKNSGAILKLMFFVASLRQLLIGLGYCATLIRVNQWKGTVPKAITERRMQKRYGKQALHGLDDNAIDAIGIGTWFLENM